MVIVDATSPQSGMIASYDGGAAIVLKPTGFVANWRKNDWVTGALPGVILFRRMSSKLREFILHRASVQFEYISMEQILFVPWALEYAVANPDNIRDAHKMRRVWKARAGVVLPSDGELTLTCDIAQTMAGADPVSRAPLTVAQPRSRSRSRRRSRSVERPMGGVGAEIPPFATAFLDRFAAKTPHHDLHKLWEQSEDVRAFAGSGIAAEPDRRSFVPSSVRYLANEDAMVSGAAASSASSGSSLSAARSVLQEYHHPLLYPLCMLGGTPLELLGIPSSSCLGTPPEMCKNHWFLNIIHEMPISS